jgi:hypothetical protein
MACYMHLLSLLCRISGGDHPELRLAVVSKIFWPSLIWKRLISPRPS